MYGILKDRQVIGLTDDIEVADRYRKDNHLPPESIIKIKRKELSPSFVNDFELIRYGHGFVPVKYYESVKDLSSQRDYDLKYSMDVIMRELREDDLSSKERKILERAVLILNDKIESDDIPSIDTLDIISSMDNDYRAAIMK